jgi:hypothetical protein
MECMMANSQLSMELPGRHCVRRSSARTQHSCTRSCASCTDDVSRIAKRQRRGSKHGSSALTASFCGATSSQAPSSKQAATDALAVPGACATVCANETPLCRRILLHRQAPPNSQQAARMQPPTRIYTGVRGAPTIVRTRVSPPETGITQRHDTLVKLPP